MKKIVNFIKNYYKVFLLYFIVCFALLSIVAFFVPFFDYYTIVCFALGNGTGGVIGIVILESMYKNEK